MSDPDAMPDPIDTAYVEAEAVLSDEAARAARRARVLAAVDRQAAPDAPAARPRPWRRGGWLVAASVSGLALVIASQVYRPSPYPPPIKPRAVPAAPAAAANAPAAAPASPAPAQAPASLTRSAPRTATAKAETPRGGIAPSASPPAAAPPVTASAPAPRAFSSAAPSPPPPPEADSAQSERSLSARPAAPPQSATAGANRAGPVSEIVVTAEKRESRRPTIPAAISAFTDRMRDAVDPGARLRAAAAKGRTDDVEVLLEHGAPVDAADAEGETALMKSIEADQPAAAALLRQHGASLDRKNHAGESARDMAKARGDAELDQAVGLSP